MTDEQAVEEHSPFGPSAAHRWMACPGSIKISKDLPDTSSEFAEEGNRAHAYAEYLLLKETGQKSGRKPPTDSDEMEYYVKKYTSVVLGELNRCQSKQASKIKLKVEGRVYIDWDERLYGTVDATFYCAQEGRTYVFDLKYGQGVPVDVHNNPQLLYYALAGCQKHPLSNSVKLVIVQPRIGGETIKVMDYTKEDIQQFEANLKRAVHRVDTKPDKLIPGPKQCRWCKASAMCPAQSIGFTDITKVEPTSKKDMTDIKTLTDDELVSIWLNRKRFTKWLEAVEALIHSKMTSGVDLEGLKLVHKTTRKAYVDQEKAVKELSKHYLDSQYLKQTLLTPNQLLTAGVDPALVEKLTTVPTGGPTVAPTTDTRKTFKLIGFDPV